MERFYDSDQDELFTEARVINPFRKSALISKPKVCYHSLFVIECYIEWGMVLGPKKNGEFCDGGMRDLFHGSTVFGKIQSKNSFPLNMKNWIV